MNLNWVALAGNVFSGDKRLLYTPDRAFHPKSPSDSGSTNSRPFEPYSTIRANLEFASGKISFDFMLSDSSARLQLVLSDAEGAPVYCGINVLDSLYGFATYQNDPSYENNNWRLLEGTGYGSTIQAETWHQLELHVHGSNLTLYLDGVQVGAVRRQLKKAPLTLYFQGWGTIEVSDVEVDYIKPECFVVMQFSDEFDTLYKEVIEPTCQEYGYEVRRGDDFYNSGMIIDDITQSIREASVIIADVTPDNANVFYEIGFAHGIGKPTILLCDRKRDKLPFDIAGFRTLYYTNSIGGKRAVEEGLRKHLANIATPRFQVPPAPSTALDNARGTGSLALPTR